MNVQDMTARIVAHVNSATPAQVAEGVTWYEDAKDFCRTLCALTQYDVKQVAAVVAALSPRTPWATNKVWASAIVGAHYNGKECPSVGTTANRNKAWAALSSEWPEAFATGPKVSQFYQNILGDSHAVTVDVWAYLGATDVKLTATKSVQKREFEPIVAAYQAAAVELGLAPSAVQAIVWVVVRGTGK